MARRSTSLNNTSDFGIGREIGSKYDSVKIVADSISDVSAVASGIPAVVNISPHLSDIATVSGSIANVNAVGTNISAVTAVYLNEVNVSTVANNISEVVAAGAGIADIEIVAKDLEGTALYSVDLGSIADPVETDIAPSDSYIRDVAENMGNITVLATEVIPNIAEILQADDNAAIAASKAGEASVYRNEALGFRDESEVFKNTATTQAQIATTKADEANASEVSASASAQSASVSASTATNKAMEAEVSAENAATSEANTAVSESNAATSEVNAANSEAVSVLKAVEASNSADASANSATSALASENKASLWAEEVTDVEVETGKYSARHWAEKASVSASVSATSAVSAQTSETNADISATSAEASAINAASYESGAENAKTDAEASAAAALISEGNASTSEANASTSETNAGISETNALASANAASVSESNASVSASNANASASAALTSATNASVSETNAAVSESNAADSEINAVNAKTAAESARDAAQIAQVAVETIYDTFDDRFLGAKSVEPVVDNDGNALVDGAMYFNSVSNVLKVYDKGGTVWLEIPQLYLSGLMDVTLTSLGTGDVLKWTGTAWENSNLQSEITNNADVSANTAVRHTHSNKAVLDNTTASFTVEEKSKLASVEEGATADQTAAEIEGLYEGLANTNKYTDAEKVKVGYLSVTQAVDLDAVDSDTNLNNVHRSSNGSDHTFIDQDVTMTASPTFAGVDLGNGVNTWNADDLALDIPLNAHVTLQVGQEQINLVRNGTGVTITNGTVVMATGTVGASGRIVVGPHDGTLTNAMRIIGIATEDIAPGVDGFVTSYGKVRGLDTTAWNAGDVLYVTPNDTGSLTNVEPTDTETNMPVAFVISSASNGTIMTRVTGFDMNHYKAWVQDKLDIMIANLSDHVADVSNPHSVTKTQVGLSQVDNTSDVGKPVSTAQEARIQQAEANALAFSVALG